MCRRSFDSMIVWHNDNSRFLWSPQSWTFDQVYSTMPEISPVKQAWYPVRELLVIPISHHVTTASLVLLHLASGYILPGKLLLQHAGSRTRGNRWCSFSPSTLRSSFWYCANEPSGKKFQVSRGWFLYVLHLKWVVFSVTKFYYPVTIEKQAHGTDVCCLGCLGLSLANRLYGVLDMGRKWNLHLVLVET